MLFRSIRTFRRYHHHTFIGYFHIQQGSQFFKKLPVSHTDFKGLMDWWGTISGASSDAANRRHDLRLQRRVVQKVQPSINKADSNHGVVKTSIKTILQRLHHPKRISDKENAYGRQLREAGNGGGSTSSLVPLQHSM